MAYRDLICEENLICFRILPRHFSFDFYTDKCGEFSCQELFIYQVNCRTEINSEKQRSFEIHLRINLGMRSQALGTNALLPGKADYIVDFTSPRECSREFQLDLRFECNMNAHCRPITHFQKRDRN